MIDTDDRSIDNGGHYTQQLATLALVGLIFFAVATLVSLLLKPDLHPATNFLSEHALGEYGFVMTAGFAILGVSILLLTSDALVAEKPKEGKKAGTGGDHDMY